MVSTETRDRTARIGRPSTIRSREHLDSAWVGLLRYGEAGQAGAATLRLDQMANASSWNAAAIRRFVGSSAASS
jgi:hypothetical protein